MQGINKRFVKMVVFSYWGKCCGGLRGAFAGDIR